MDREARILTRTVPGLDLDSSFTITSPQDEYYNCISWALEISDRWVWPLEPDDSDDDDITEDVVYWPSELPLSDSIDNFIALFQLYGYELCENGDYETSMKKVVLYAKNGSCTHASRQLSNGLWTSKMGPLNDIQHGIPESLEGNFFGKIHCFMKKKA